MKIQSLSNYFGKYFKMILLNKKLNNYFILLQLKKNYQLMDLKGSFARVREKLKFIKLTILIIYLFPTPVI